MMIRSIWSALVGRLACEISVLGYTGIGQQGWRGILHGVYLHGAFGRKGLEQALGLLFVTRPAGEIAAFPVGFGDKKRTTFFFEFVGDFIWNEGRRCEDEFQRLNFASSDFKAS